jgi:predicted RND superfamily exporter protein
MILVALLLTAASIWGAIYIPIYTSRKALLPQNTEVAKRMQNFLDKFGSASDLIVVLEKAPREQMEKFATELAKRLRVTPGIRQAHERVDIYFFLKNAYLLIPPKPLRQFASVLKHLISAPVPDDLVSWDSGYARVERWLEDPPPLGSVEMDLNTAEESLHLVLFFLEEWQRWLSADNPPKSIHWQKLVARHEGAKLAAGKGYFSSHNNKMLFVFVSPDKVSEEFEHVAPFIHSIHKVADDLQKEYTARGQTPPQLALAGLPAAIYEEYSTLKSDITFTVSTAAILILLLICLWLRSIKWALIVFVPMGLGVVWNIGVTYLLVGHLTMITSGFTAILFGLGVDYGIFLSTRIIEEREKDVEWLAAILNGVKASVRALTIAGGATLLIFGALALVPFPGFAELGLVASIGVFLVLVSTFLLQPALFSLLSPKTRKVVRRKFFKDADQPNRLKFRRLVNVTIVVTAIFMAVFGTMAMFTIPFDYDILSLLPKGSQTAHYQKRMIEESDFQAEVVILTAPTAARARSLAQSVEKLDSISQIQSITNLFPADSRVRTRMARQIGETVSSSEYLKRILSFGDFQLSQETHQRIESFVDKVQELLEDSEELAFSAGHQHLVKLFEKILAKLELVKEKLDSNIESSMARTESYAQTILTAAKQSLEVLAGWKDAQVMTPQNLPALLRDRFFANDGTMAIYAYPAESIYDPENLDQLMSEVYAVSPEATGFPATHQVFSKMVVDSFRQGTILAMLCAIIWILLILRSLRGTIIALFPLLIGGGWMMAFMSVADHTFNFANIIALPLVMGLGVDYGVWFAHRRRELKDQSSWHVARVAGKAILLAAGTTLAGLGAITLADYQGISSMGIAITIGLICCVLAALLVSPALTQLLFIRDTRRQKCQPDE